MLTFSSSLILTSTTLWHEKEAYTKPRDEQTPIPMFLQFTFQPASLGMWLAHRHIYLANISFLFAWSKSKPASN